MVHRELIVEAFRDDPAITVETRAMAVHLFAFLDEVQNWTTKPAAGYREVGRAIGWDYRVVGRIAKLLKRGGWIGLEQTTPRSKWVMSVIKNPARGWFDDDDLTHADVSDGANDLTHADVSDGDHADVSDFPDLIHPQDHSSNSLSSASPADGCEEIAMKEENSLARASRDNSRAAQISQMTVMTAAEKDVALVAAYRRLLVLQRRDVNDPAWHEVGAVRKEIRALGGRSDLPPEMLLRELEGQAS